MKKAQNKMMVRGIAKSFTRFLSIFGIVAIGAGFLAGLLAAAPDMKKSTDKYFDENNFYDVDIKSTVGFTADDIKALNGFDGVDKVMPAYVTDSILTDDNSNTYNARIFGYLTYGGSTLNNTVLLQGRLPKAKNECLAEIPNEYTSSEIKIGSILKFSPDNSNYDTLSDTYAAEDFTVVGLVKSPMFVSVESEQSTVGTGKVNLAVYTLESAYSLPVYTDLYLTLENAAALNAFYGDYETLCDNFTAKLEPFADARCVMRYAEIYSEAEKLVSDAENELTSQKRTAQEKLDNAQGELDDARKEISDGKAALNDAQAQIDSGETALASAEAAIAQSEAQYAEQLALYNAGKAQLEENAAAVNALKQLAQSGAELSAEQLAIIAQYDETAAVLETSGQQLSAARGALDSAAAQIAAQRAQLESAKAEIEQNRAKLENAEQELNDGTADYNKARQEFDDEFSKAEAELNDAKSELADIKSPEWYIFDRTSNVGFNSYKTNVEKVNAIAKVFPVFFFAVAALVALTTMTRMVEEERAQTGAMKSLGYSDWQILRYYLIYSGGAALLGCVVGFAVGFRAFPKIINKAYGMLFNSIPIKTPVIPSIALIIGLVTVVGILLTTYSACRSELREKPAMLLVPKAPKAGKRILLERIPFIWNRFSFTQKVTARNLFRYKKRLFMTLIGISGCSALLVTGFGIRDSINDIVDKQYGEIITYNHAMMLENPDDIETNEVLNKFFADKTLVSDYMAVSNENVTVTFNGEKQSAVLQSSDNTEKFKTFVTLRQFKDKKDIPFNDESVIINEKLAELLHIEVGDSITLTLDGGEKATAAVSGICESYLNNNVFVSQSMYRTLFGEDSVQSMILSKINAADSAERDKLSQRILSSDSVIYQTFTDNIKDSFSKSVKSIDYIVMILIFCAGLLSVIVVYNLTNINICERKKELATIKVLGFFDRETQNYIFRETNLISIGGILLGLVLGIFLHKFVIYTVELESVMFGRRIYWQSFIFAAIIEALFTMLVNLILRKKIKAIDMVEAMKTND